MYQLCVFVCVCTNTLMPGTFVDLKGKLSPSTLQIFRGLNSIYQVWWQAPFFCWTISPAYTLVNRENKKRKFIKVSTISNNIKGDTKSIFIRHLKSALLEYCFKKQNSLSYKDHSLSSTMESQNFYWDLPKNFCLQYFYPNCKSKN